MPNIDEMIQFTRTKDFKYIRTLGSGGFGETLLLLDETTNIEFAFKKFQPLNEIKRDKYFDRFVDEIKILFRIYHTNIVRIYNYYLFPEYKAGYIQMEFINGIDIEQYRKKSSGNEWNQIFVDLINAFKYLEDNKILHRDIRSANIMIDVKGNPRIIDFGFGKELSEGVEEGKSVLLNWPVSELPDEIKEKTPNYSHQTEIYFLGKLFKKLKLSSCKDFKYDYIIGKMCKADPNERYASFNDLSEAIAKKEFRLLEFSDNEKEIYKKFADSLYNIVAKHYGEFKPYDEISLVISKLEKIVKIADIEEDLQYLPDIIDCFVENRYSYFPRKDFKTKTLIDFYKMLITFNDEKQQAVLDNITARLKRVDIEYEVDDLPF